MRISSQTLGVVRKAVVIVLLASTASLALTTTVQGQARSLVKSPVEPAGQGEVLTAFLATPIDLVTFKEKKGPSNSGSFKENPWIYRPEEPGFFYQYKLFGTPARFSDGERLRGFSVVVYKFGKKIGDYYDSNETLIAIWSRLRDPDLGQADLVGKSVPEIKERFGEPFAAVGDVLIYHHHGRALSVHTKDGTVDWFKYVRLSRGLEAPGAVPGMLLQPGPGW